MTISKTLNETNKYVSTLSDKIQSTSDNFIQASNYCHQRPTYLNQGSIMLGTPITSISLSNKSMTDDISLDHCSNSRNDFIHHPLTYIDSLQMKTSSKILDQQQANQMHQCSYQHHNYPTATSLQQQIRTNMNQFHEINSSNTNTYETLRADFVTSKYLTAEHSPNHER